MTFQGIPKFASQDEAIAWCHAEIDRFRAEGYVPRPYAFHTPAGATSADLFCLSCKGFGIKTDTHAYGDPTTGPCPRCGGTGLQA